MAAYFKSYLAYSLYIYNLTKGSEKFYSYRSHLSSLNPSYPNISMTSFLGGMPYDILQITI